jgi:hypothetical protein
MLQDVRGQPIAYRVRDPKKDDFDTYILKPRKKKITRHDVHTWEVAQDIRFRERTRYDKTKDEISDDLVETDEIRHTKFIALPSLGVFAVDDSISERSLGARSAVGRFTAIIETHFDDWDVRVNFAGTPQDAQRALETWELDQFSFTVRPFNPTPSKLGEKVHELLIADRVGSLRAVAFPDESKEMRDSYHGIIAEAKGLSDAGYGQYGASGTTPDGLRASLSKPKFEKDKKKNIERQAQNRTLKVYIQRGETLEEEEKAIVKALVELYERPAAKA